MRLLLLVALFALGCDESTDLAVDSDVDTDAGDPNADADFAFCHEAGVDAGEVARWCAILKDAPPDACPGMRETCAAGPFVRVGGCASGWGGGGGYGRESESSSRWLEPASCDAPEPGAGGLLGAILRWGGALLAAIVVVVVGRLLLRQLGLWKPRPRVVAASVTSAPTIVEGDDDLPALPEDELLAEARRALQEGRFGDAVVWARGAALRRLARRGLLTLHRARTDREYVRGVRRDPELTDALTTVLGAVEDHRFAGRVLTSARATEAVRAAGRILAALLLALLLPGSAHAGSRYGPDGHEALHRLVEGAGWEIVPIADELGPALADARILVLDTTEVTPSADDLTAISSFVIGGGVLIVGGRAPAPFDAQGTFALAETGGEPVAAPSLADAGVAAPVWPAGSLFRFCDGTAEVLVAEGLPPLFGPASPVDPDPDTGSLDTDAEDEVATCARPALVAGYPFGTGRVITIADPAVLRNAAMIVTANRRFLPALVDLAVADGVIELPEVPGVVLATASGGQAAPNPWRAVANARLLPFVLQLLLLWALLGASVGWPLSPLRDPPDAGRRDFGEHAIALGRHWARVGATRHAAAAFARLQLARLGPDGIAAAAVRGGRDAAAARALVRRVEALAADPDGPDDPDDLNTVEMLWTLTRSRPS